MIRVERRQRSGRCQKTRQKLPGFAPSVEVVPRETGEKRRFDPVDLVDLVDGKSVFERIVARAEQAPGMTRPEMEKRVPGVGRVGWARNSGPGALARSGMIVIML